MQTFKKGARVAIVNREYSGDFIFEGWATVLRAAEDKGRYVVRFDNTYGGSDEVVRAIDPAAQFNPQKYVDLLNKPRRERQLAELSKFCGI